MNPNDLSYISFQNASMAVMDSKQTNSNLSLDEKQSISDDDENMVRFNETKRRSKPIRAFTFLYKNTPRREKKKYDVGYVLKSLLYSQQFHKKVYLQNESEEAKVQHEKLFHPKISRKSRLLTRNTEVSMHTKSSMAKVRPTESRMKIKVNTHQNFMRSSLGFSYKRRKLNTASIETQRLIYSSTGCRTRNQSKHGHRHTR